MTIRVIHLTPLTYCQLVEFKCFSYESGLHLAEIFKTH
jgi:hypothetical protein